MFRFFSLLIAVVAVAFGAYYVHTQKPELKNKFFEVISSGQFHTLEARYTAGQIMETNKKDLLKGDRYKFVEPTLKFFPYLMMEVKYSTELHRTGEGVILWDLTDGEMVLNTKDWEKTHGFGDCIGSATERYEFKIINLLSERGGVIDRDSISKNLQIETGVLDLWLESCKRKKLIVQIGNFYRLHFQNPKIHVTPATQLHDRIVTKSYKNAERLPRRFSPSQIRRTAESAFGNDFAIRSTMDVFLPVYSITVQNPDGSMHTSYWNALNGKMLSQGAYIH